MDATTTLPVVPVVESTPPGEQPEPHSHPHPNLTICVQTPGVEQPIQPTVPVANIQEAQQQQPPPQQPVQQQLPPPAPPQQQGSQHFYGAQWGLDMGRQYVNAYANVFTDVTKRSPFEFWQRDSLINLLILQNIELRHEDELTVDQLVAVCNQVFAGRPMPPTPPSMTPEELVLASRAASHIQHRWILKNRARKMAEMRAEAEKSRLFATGGIIKPPSASGHENNLVTARVLSPTSAWQELEQEWVKPDVEVAKEYAEYNHPRLNGPNGDLFPLKKTTLGRYCLMGGCGEQLDLWDEGTVSELAPFGPGITNYFKFEKWCAWVFLCLSGIYLPQMILNTFGGGLIAPTSYMDIAYTTIGNLAKTFSSSDSVTIPLCSIFSKEFQTMTCTLHKTAVAKFYAYIDIAACTFVFLAFMWLKEFQNREARHLDRHTVTASDYTIKIKSVPKKITENDIKQHFIENLKLPVVHVALGYNNGREIMQYQERGNLVKERSYVVNRYRYINTLKKKYKASQVWFLIRELPYLKQRNDKLLRKIQVMDMRIGVQTCLRRPLCAFVTFNTQEAMIQALAAYKFSFYNYLFMSPQLRLMGHRIRVAPAPEPSLIQWENLQYGSIHRFGRKTATTLMAAPLILLSILIAFISKYYQQQSQMVDTGCPIDINSWDAMTVDQKTQLVKGDNSYLGCCSSMGIVDQAYDAVCKEFLSKRALAFFWTFFASFSVVAINYAIQMALERMTRYEKHHSLDAQQLEICIRVFVLKFINTGVVCLLLNVKQLQDILNMPLVSAFNFSEGWYYTSGVSLIVVMVINVIGPVGPSLLYYWRARKAQKAAEKGQLERFMTQEALNNVFMGPEFEVSIRYASLLVTFFVSFIYASGMPALVLLGALSFSLGYWVDKFLFLRYHRIPPQYGMQLSQGVANVVPWALVLHLIVSMWAYSDRSFKTGTDVTAVGRWLVHYIITKINTRLMMKHITPLLLALAALIALAVLFYIMATFTTCTRKVLSFLTCNCIGIDNSINAQKFSNLNSIDVTYQRAVERGLIKGLATYNILQNPKYKKAFAISDAFAMRHSHVDSIKGTLQQFDDDNESEDGGSENDEELSQTFPGGANLPGQVV